MTVGSSSPPRASSISASVSSVIFGRVTSVKRLLVLSCLTEPYDPRVWSQAKRKQMPGSNRSANKLMVGSLKWGPGSFDFPSSIQDVYAEVKRSLIQGGYVDGKAGLWLVILDKFDDDTAQRALEVNL